MFLSENLDPSLEKTAARVFQESCSQTPAPGGEVMSPHRSCTASRVAGPCFCTLPGGGISV